MRTLHLHPVFKNFKYMYSRKFFHQMELLLSVVAATAACILAIVATLRAPASVVHMPNKSAVLVTGGRSGNQHESPHLKLIGVKLSPVPAAGLPLL